MLYAAVAIRLLATGMPLHATYAQYVQHRCVTQRHPVCGRLLRQMNGSWVLGVAGVWLIPVIVGVFAGAPLGSRDFETGSYRFSQVQGVSRRRQLGMTLLIIGALVVGGAALTGALTMWCLAPFHRISLLPDTGISYWWPNYFDVTAVTLAGWALLDFCLGVLAGVLIRRTVPAMAVAAACGLILAVAGGSSYGAFGGTGLFVLGYRVIPAPTQTLIGDLLTVAPNAKSVVPRIWAEVNYNPVTQTGSPAQPGSHGPVSEIVVYPADVPGPQDSYQISGWFTRAGQRLSSGAAQAMLDTIPRSVAARRTLTRRWMTARQIRFWIGYQPAGRYWLLQALAAALLCAAAALAAMGALWRAGRAR